MYQEFIVLSLQSSSEDVRCLGFIYSKLKGLQDIKRSTLELLARKPSKHLSFKSELLKLMSLIATHSSYSPIIQFHFCIFSQYASKILNRKLKEEIIYKF